MSVGIHAALIVDVEAFRRWLPMLQNSRMLFVSNVSRRAVSAADLLGLRCFWPGQPEQQPLHPAWCLGPATQSHAAELFRRKSPRSRSAYRLGANRKARSIGRNRPPSGMPSTSFSLSRPRHRVHLEPQRRGSRRHGSHRPRWSGCAAACRPAPPCGYQPQADRARRGALPRPRRALFDTISISPWSG